MCKCRKKKGTKTFFIALGTPEGYETSAGLFPTDYLRPEFFKKRDFGRFYLPNPRPEPARLPKPIDFIEFS